MRPIAGLAASAALCLTLTGPGSALAADVSITGAAMNRFGRIVLTFDQATKVQVRNANAILVVTFDTKARIRREQLASELPGYVSTVRRDPDETGFRLALAGPVKTNVIQAGEKVFIDLLPPNWTGFPPTLPPEIIADLAERARVAETKLREEATRKPDPPRPVALKTAELPTLTRLVLEPPAGTPVDIRDDGGAVEVKLRGNFTLDSGDGRAKGAPGVADFVVSRTDAALTVRVVPAEGYAGRAFADEASILIDLAKPGGPPPSAPVATPRRSPESKPPPGVVASAPPAKPQAPAPAASPAGHAEGHAEKPGPPAEPAKAAAPAPAAPPARPGPGEPSPPPRPAETAAKPPAPESVATAPARAPGTPLKLVFERRSDIASILFPFATPTAAAALERSGSIVLVFETRDRLDGSAVPVDLASPVDSLETDRQPEVAPVRLGVRQAGIGRLLAEGTGWRLTFGDPNAMPPDALAVNRGLDSTGHPEVTVSPFAASATRWLRDPSGARFAVVPTVGRPKAIASGRRFVEFALPPSLQGVAVEAFSDDLTVTAGQEGIVIGRPGGLSLSEAGLSRGGPVRQLSGLVLSRDAWIADTAGDPSERLRALMVGAAEADRQTRSAARFQLARFLVAAGMNLEAGTVLGAIRRDDTVFGTRREVAVLSGIAAIRAGRLAEGLAFLQTDPLKEDPEAQIWRAYMDLKEKRLPTGLAELLRVNAALSAYPEELAAPIRQLAAAAALDLGTLSRVESELAALDRMPSVAVPRDMSELVRARFDEASDRSEQALKSYERLAEEGERPIAAEATLRQVSLALRLRKMDPDEALKRLEALSVTWRGDDIELGALVELSRLHAQAGRWRRVFSIASQVNQRFPKHELTRSLYEETAHLFESLLLGEAGTKLSPVETLALYYDFRQFAPAGRKGDEIVRRLADRLVELDLLGQAAELLQYQVDNRLTGATRASVAGRLAAIRLLNGQPNQALSVLNATRMAELPAATRRVRLLLEARSLADLTRTDVALELTDGQDDPDFHRLRSWIMFNAGRWREAGEAGEMLLGTTWREPGPLGERGRQDVLRAAIAYVLADEQLGLDRLKFKFRPKMADSPDAKAFDLAVQPDAATSREFRILAQEATKADGLRELLRDWATTAGGSGERAQAKPDSAG